MGKYALVLLRRFRELTGNDRDRAKFALQALEALGMLDDGRKGAEREFFVIRLKDTFARSALMGYANAVACYLPFDPEYHAAIMDMANRSGGLSDFHKHPD